VLYHDHQHRAIKKLFLRFPFHLAINGYVYLTLTCMRTHWRHERYTKKLYYFILFCFILCIRTSSISQCLIGLFTCMPRQHNIMLFIELAQICTHLLDIDRSGAELGRGCSSAVFKFRQNFAEISWISAVAEKNPKFCNILIHVLGNSGLIFYIIYVTYSSTQ